MYWRHRNPNTTISVGDATFSVAKLKVPGTEIEATTLVGEMLLPSDVPGTAERRLVAIGTAVEWAGVEVASPADVRYLVLDRPSARTTRRGGRQGRRQASRRRER